jgi:hypothetical protein
MFAISVPSKTYHLLYPTGDFTLCGFKAQREDVPISSRSARLHKVTVIPPKRFLCKQCAKMQERRQAKEGESN